MKQVKILAGDKLIQTATGRRGVALRNQWRVRVGSRRGIRVLVRITHGADRGAKVIHFANRWEVTT